MFYMSTVLPTLFFLIILIKGTNSDGDTQYVIDPNKSLASIHGHWVKWGSVSPIVAGNSMNLYLMLYDSTSGNFVPCMSSVMRDINIEFDPSQEIYYGNRRQPITDFQCSNEVLYNNMSTVKVSVTLYTQLQIVESTLILTQPSTIEGKIEMVSSDIISFRVNPDIVNPAVSGIIGVTAEEATLSYPDSLVQNGYIQTNKPFQIPVVLADRHGNKTPSACTESTIELSDESEGEGTKSIKNLIYTYDSHSGICYIVSSLDNAEFKSSKNIGMKVFGVLAQGEASSQPWFKDTFPSLSEGNRTTQQFIQFNFLQDKDWTFYVSIIMSAIFFFTSLFLFWFQFIKKIRLQIKNDSSQSGSLKKETNSKLLKINSSTVPSTAASSRPSISVEYRNSNATANDYNLPRKNSNLNSNNPINSSGYLNGTLSNLYISDKETNTRNDDTEHLSHNFSFESVDESLRSNDSISHKHLKSPMIGINGYKRRSTSINGNNTLKDMLN